MATATAKPDVATLRRLYHGEKLTVAAIADDLGVAASTVHNWLVAAGVTRRPSPATRRTNLSDRQIVRLYTDDGHTAAEIAERLGCSVSLVYARLAHAGVPVVRAPPAAGSAPTMASSPPATPNGVTACVKWPSTTG